MTNATKLERRQIAIGEFRTDPAPEEGWDAEISPLQRFAPDVWQWFDQQYGGPVLTGSETDVADLLVSDVAVYTPHVAALAALDSVLAEPEWRKVVERPSQQTCDLARQLVSVIPVDYLSGLEFGVDSSGWVNLCWQPESYAILTLSVKAGERVVFARRLLGKTLSGGMDFAEKIPSSILEEIRLVTSAGNQAEHIRPAAPPS